MTVARPEPRQNTKHSSIPAEPPVAPVCRNCGTDAYLFFEDYLPATYGADGSGLRPPSVGHICGNCGEFRAHDVPFDWSPPGWHWYA